MSLAPGQLLQLPPLHTILRGGKRSGLGSGWVLDAGDGIVVTAAHVVNTGRLYYADDKLASLLWALIEIGGAASNTTRVVGWREDAHAAAS